MEDKGKEAAIVEESVSASPSGLENVRDEGCMMYKTKTIKFLGRSTPIVLQNENGPCPLLAICNVLLLRNDIQLNPDAYEVSQEQLLLLVADRLLESNSNIKTKDEEYVNNQQQNISDAIDLLPRLATGIDVNVHFRKINDFEFTPECAIFDLLDIGLYHGWIVDPEDKETALAIGSKSYNTLVGELVALETRPSVICENNLEEDSIDFVASTAATFGIPHPSLSACRSFSNSSDATHYDKIRGKGDLEEEAELLEALKLSTSDVSKPIDESSIQDTHRRYFNTHDSATQSEALHVKPDDGFVTSTQTNLLDSQVSESLSVDAAVSGHVMENDNQSSGGVVGGVYVEKSMYEQPVRLQTSTDMKVTVTSFNETSSSLFTPVSDEQITVQSDDNGMDEKQEIHASSGPSLVNNIFSENNPNTIENSIIDDLTSFSFHPIPTSHSDSTEVMRDNLEDANSTSESTEPIYEGEECIIDSGHSIYENREPVYEGEVVLAHQIFRHSGSVDIHMKRETSQSQSQSSGSSNITSEEGKLINDFLKINASQLTICGLFHLLEGLNERKLCVFFRNNHFSTMFKFNRDLYLLATDQGYINQPDLVWEKLNEVNGNTIFMTSDFKEFKVDNSGDYLSTIKDSSQESATIEDADYKLAMELQEQEYKHENQPQCQPQPVHNSQQPSGTNGGSSRLIVGPQAPRPIPPHQQRQESKSKDKCVVM